MSLVKRKKYRVYCPEHSWFEREWHDQPTASRDWQDHNREFHKGRLVAIMQQDWG